MPSSGLVTLIEQVISLPAFAELVVLWLVTSSTEKVYTTNRDQMLFVP